MNDALTELINQKIDKKIAESDIVHSLYAKVISPLENGMYVVELLPTKTQLILPNWTGSELDIDENVQVFYKGEIISERTAYIGSSFYKDDIASRNRVKYIVGTSKLGVITTTQRTIATIKFEALQKTKVFVVLNSNIWGNETGFSTVYIYMDGQMHEYVPKTTVTANYDSVQSFTLPFDVTKGKHVVDIRASGSGDYIDIYAFVFGQGLNDKDTYDPTDEDDYIYTGGTIIYYIGETTTPLMPVTLDNVPVTTLLPTAFCGNEELETVKIQNGVTRIE
jgi:hypothetical protein